MILGFIKAHYLTRPTRQCYITYRCYCDGKSIHQRGEEGKPPREVYGIPYPEWRKPWIERDGEFRSKLSVFVRRRPNPNILSTLQKLPNFSINMVKEWWADMKELQEVENQKYISQRVEILGSNLAAVHYFTYRGAAVRLKYSNNWLTGVEESLKLPNRFEKGYDVEAIDCSNFSEGGLRYEGLENLQDLPHLKWLSLKNNKLIDVWGLDRIAGQNGSTLEYLDITGCKMTAGCIQALARMTSLKLLIVSIPDDDEMLQTGLSLLEEDNSKLLIKVVDQ